MEGLRACPTNELVVWAAEVEYICQIWVSLETDDMETRFWEKFTLEGIPYRETL
jgi:hypothetical protein